jgi:hypothetical protein
LPSLIVGSSPVRAGWSKSGAQSFLQSCSNLLLCVEMHTAIPPCLGPCNHFLQYHTQS